MTKKDTLQSIARKVTGDNTLKCNTVRSALHCIAEKAKGEETNCKTINEALTCIDENIENLIGGDRTAETITITENGVVNTPAGKYYDPITVNVPVPELEDNKSITITSNGTSEVTPTLGKDGMEKVTVNVNVSGGSSKRYAYVSTEIGAVVWIKHEHAEADEKGELLYYSNPSSMGVVHDQSVIYVSDTELFVTGEGPVVFTRHSNSDLIL